MTDSFDIQRERDHAGEAMVDEAMDRLEDSKEQSRERAARLVRLDDAHYFDPKDKLVLRKEKDHFHKLAKDPVQVPRPVEAIEEEAGRQGLTVLDGGLFWNAGEKELFVKNGGHYVLYSRDRRKTAR